MATQMSTHTYMEVFFSWWDAVRYIEGYLEDYPKNDWEIVECRIVYLNGAWRAGISFKRLSNG
jgi:hypothetical protein